MTKKTAIVFVGMPGSGKTSAAKACESLGLRVYTSGDIIRETTEELDLEPTKENMAKVSRFFHDDHVSWLISELKKDVKTKKKLFVIEGLRSKKQLKLLNKHFKTVVIAIRCSKKERFRRLHKRKRSDDPSKMKDLEERDKREIGFGVKSLINSADYAIDTTEMTKKEADRAVRDLVRKVFKL